MRLLIDTNRYRDLVARDLEATSVFQTADAAWISLISLGELHAGFAFGSRRESNLERLDQFLNLQGVGVLDPDVETAEFYGEISAQLRTNGGMIPTNDVWIAALAKQHDLTLDTRDQHFKKIPGLKYLDF